VSVLASGSALRDVLREEPARRALAGKALINLTSTSAREARQLEAFAAEAGALAFLDVATISFPNEIAAGRGKILASGADDALARWEGLLAILGTVERLGPVGAASAAEVAFFLQYALHQHAYLSGRALLERSRLPGDVLDRMVNDNSLFSSPLFGVYARFTQARAYTPALMTIEHYARILRVALDDVEDVGMDRTIVATILQAADEAAAAHGADADWTCIYERLR
jgi:3-hydroxyisobutyrate dehydrogenase-like beta-hydroxyacid dehydrogenase